MWGVLPAMILIPMKHDNDGGPALAGLNILAFFGTHWTMQEQARKLAEVRLHLLVLAAEHPEPKNVGQGATAGGGPSESQSESLGAGVLSVQTCD